MFLFFMLLSLKLCFSENFMARKFRMEYFGGKILVQGFFEVLFEALEIFLGIDFRPLIRSSIVT